MLRVRGESDDSHQSGVGGEIPAEAVGLLLEQWDGVLELGDALQLTRNGQGAGAEGGRGFRVHILTT